MSIPEITVKLNERQLNPPDENVKEVMKVVRPQWTEELIWKELKRKTFTDGITNKLIRYFLEEDPRDGLIFKIYGEGTENIIDRHAEVETMKFLYKRNMGANIYGTFGNGIVYEFIPGTTLDTTSCRDEAIYPLVAEKMANLHSIPIHEAPPTNKSAFWEKLNTFLSLANQILMTNPTISKKCAVFGLTTHWTNDRYQVLKTRLNHSGMPRSFCHNDILLANILFDDLTPKISFIDYEYACINYAPFDVANHFNEFAGKGFIIDIGVEDADFTLCPDDAFMLRWIQEYLKHYKGKSVVGITEFKHWVKLCIPLSHLFWILWTVVQAQNSEIDFDFIAYGKKRFIEFEKRLKCTAFQNGAI